ncbi:MAG: hypothetical protein J2P53_11315, partial [Bradyrhizobiaceae bacterium]|nr:hypothetical protein [Bradyrhizobiaceae bacterium]
MTRRMLPVLLSMMLLAPLPAAGAGSPGSRAAKSATRSTDNHAAALPATKSTEGGVAVTRSDGSTGFTKPPDPKDIR